MEWDSWIWSNHHEMTRIAGIVDPVCDCILHVKRNPLVGDKGRGAEIAEAKPDSNQLNRISIDMLLLPHLKQRKHMMTHSATLPSIVTHAPLSHDTTHRLPEWREDTHMKSRNVETYPDSTILCGRNGSIHDVSVWVEHNTEAQHEQSK